jgi:hypothetical protein
VPNCPNYLASATKAGFAKSPRLFSHIRVLVLRARERKLLREVLISRSSNRRNAWRERIKGSRAHTHNSTSRIVLLPRLDAEWHPAKNSTFHLAHKKPKYYILLYESVALCFPATPRCFLCTLWAPIFLALSHFCCGVRVHLHTASRRLILLCDIVFDARSQKGAPS